MKGKTQKSGKEGNNQGCHPDAVVVWSAKKIKKERKQSTNPKKLRVAWKKSLQNKEKIYQLQHPKDVDNNQPMQKKETI